MGHIPDRLVGWGDFDEQTQTVTVHYVRDLARVESDAHARGVRILTAMSHESAYRTLHDSALRVHEAVEVLADSMRTRSRNVDRDTFELHTAVKAWLSNMRSFDDHTSAWLSREFGPSSHQFQEFKRLLSLQYDCNFAYRMCAALRNASEHVAPVVNAIHYTSRELSDGTTEDEIFIGFDGPRLAEQFGDMKPGARRELERVTQPIRLEAVVDAMMLSCTAAFQGLFVVLEPEIESAVSQIRDLNREAVEAGGHDGCLMHLPSVAEGRPLQGAEMGVKDLGLTVAKMGTENLRQSQPLRGGRGVELDASDLT